MDFPKIPFTDDIQNFQTLAKIGSDLAAAHLLESIPRLNVGEPMERHNYEVSNIRYEDNRLYYNKIQYFDTVSPAVWAFQIGGYKVLEKYLKDRKNQNIEPELNHIQNIIKVLTFTVAAMSEIDILTQDWI